MGGEPLYQNSEHSHRSNLSDETESDDDGEWYPGDGICPSTSQFNVCYKTRFNIWRTAAAACPEGSETISFYIAAFLNLLKDVPPFLHNPPQGINITGGRRSPLVLRSSLQLETTSDSNCSQSQKSIDYLQCLGIPAPVTYKTEIERKRHIAFPLSSTSLSFGYFTTIALAWSYIISCRWVEIFQQKGENSEVLHDPDVKSHDSFWDMITQSRWLARVQNKKGMFYSPWMLRGEGTSSKAQGDWVPVAPDSSHAFHILLDYCISEGLEGEILLGLTSVMILTSRNIPRPKLTSPRAVSRRPVRYPHQDTVFHGLFREIDKCMFLSSTQDALDSLLCSAFFDPSVPCNIVGAASLGVKKALLPTDEVDNQLFLNAIIGQKPHLTLFWATVICGGQEKPLLNMALNGLPPLCLVAAFLTNTVQSFLQVSYCLEGTESAIYRANEFQASYFSRPQASVPWSPAPPFGRTALQNLSLEIREHLSHQHKPYSWMIHWNLSSGSKIAATPQHPINLGEVLSIRDFCDDLEQASLNAQCPESHLADEQSWSATYRLFNWHRYYDDGIWFDDGTTDIETIRRLQIHPWIIDQFDDGNNEPVEEDVHRELHRERILEWSAQVQKYR